MMVLRLFDLYIIILNKRRKKEMAVIYVALIVKGKRKFSQVPEAIKEQVRQLLIELELEYLIDE